LESAWIGNGLEGALTLRDREKSKALIMRTETEETFTEKFKEYNSLSFKIEDSIRQIELLVLQN